MFFAQLKSVVRSLRFRLMVWNALIMLIASLGVLWGMREGVRYTLLSELDDDLQDDFGEVSLALVNVFEPSSPFFHAGMDRKARGHKQSSWFLQVIDPRFARQRLVDAIKSELRRREEMRRWEQRRIRRFNPSDTSGFDDRESSTAATSGSNTDTTTSADGQISEAEDTEALLHKIETSAFPLSQETLDQLVARYGQALLDAVELDVPGPRIIWQTFNVPDWGLRKVSQNFEGFLLSEGAAATVDDYRVMERLVSNSRGGPVRVRIGASLRSIQHLAATTDRMMLLNILAALVVAPLGGYWLALRATRPLQAMIRTSDRLRPQQMDERLPLSHTEDEIDQLSRAFNRLLDRIAEYLVKRQDLLANSAHELRTPLAALRTSAELALKSPRSVAEYCEVLDSIVTECGNLELLVNQLLLLSETESAHFESRGETVDLSKITNEAGDMFEAVAESRGVELKMEVADGIVIDGSRLHLRQLLNNLIDNAIKFIPAQGSVTVQLQAVEDDIVLTVRDSGIGISADEQQRLFERFYRGDKARRRSTPTRGTGLGLSISRAIAEAHGGSIAIASQVGVGTTVTVIFPPQTRARPALVAPVANS